MARSERFWGFSLLKDLLQESLPKACDLDMLMVLPGVDTDVYGMALYGVVG